MAGFALLRRLVTILLKSRLPIFPTISNALLGFKVFRKNHFSHLDAYFFDTRPSN
jgi:hypothetical protein